MKLEKILYSRYSWIALMLACLSFIMVGLYFQEVKKLAPCFLCINQRMALIVIMFGGLIGSIKPKNKKIIGTGFFFWILGGIYGISAAIYQVYLQKNPTPDFSCGPDMDYLIEIKGRIEAFRILLDSPGNCSDVSWVFLGFSIAEWMVLIFSSFLIVAFYFLKHFVFIKIK